MSGLFEKLLIGFVFITLFVILSQPAWRGEAMAEQFKEDCSKRGGVLLEHKKTFGIEYKCASRLD